MLRKTTGSFIMPVSLSAWNVSVNTRQIFV